MPRPSGAHPKLLLWERLRVISGRRGIWLFIPVLVSLLILAGCTGRDLISWGSGWTPTAVSDGVVYVGTRDGRVMALDANRNGNLRGEEQVKWRFAPEGDERVGGVFGAPAVGEEFVYVADRGNGDGDGARLYALRKDRGSDGAIRSDMGEWRKDVGGAVVGGPALADGLVLIGSDDGNLSAYYTAGDTPGRLAWRFATDGQIWSTPVVDDGVAYFGSMDRHVYAVLTIGDRAGEEVWRYETGGAVVSRPLQLDGMLIVGSFDKKLYALDSTDGRFLWSFGGTDWFWAGPVSDGEYIFAPSMDGTVYALDKEGSPVWSAPFKAESPVVSTPVLIDDMLVVATDGGKLHLLGTSDGGEREVFKDLQGGRVKAPLSREDNVVFIGAENSTVRGMNVERWSEVWQISTRE